MSGHHPGKHGSADGRNPESPQRRDFLSKIAAFFMGFGLLASYGTFGSFILQFLYPSKPQRKEWLFLAELSRLKTGDSMTYEAPNGEKVAIARRGSQGDVSDFIALSSTCPHLGCQVHWESNNNRFFCPCHNGVFNPEGAAIAGPPAEAKQNLPRYSLKIEKGLLYIHTPVERLDNHLKGLNLPLMPGNKTFLRPGGLHG